MEILNIEKIEATELSCEANIVTLDSVPTLIEQEELFINDSIVLEF